MNELSYTLFNLLLSQFDLKWNGRELRYIKNKSNLITICNDINKIYYFLKLPKDFGKNIVYDCHHVANSRFYNKKLFKSNKSKIKPFLDIIEKYDYKSTYHAKNKLNVLKTLKKYFKIDLSILPENNIKNYSKDDIKSKINLKLILHWLNVKGENINYNYYKNVLTSFTSYILFYKHTDAMKYFHYNTATDIRTDFLEYIYYRYDINAPNSENVYFTNEFPF